MCSNGCSSSQSTCGKENKEVQRIQMGQLEEIMSPAVCATVFGCGGGGGSMCVCVGGGVSGPDPHLVATSLI